MRSLYQVPHNVSTRLPIFIYADLSLTLTFPDLVLVLKESLVFTLLYYSFLGTLPQPYYPYYNVYFLTLFVPWYTRNRYVPFFLISSFETRHPKSKFFSYTLSYHILCSDVLQSIAFSFFLSVVIIQRPTDSGVYPSIFLNIRAVVPFPH